MAHVDVRRIGPDERPLLEQLHDIAWRASAEERPWHGLGNRPAALLRWTEPPNDAEVTVLAAFIDGVPVGVADVALNLADNTHLGELFVFVDPGRTREGAGTALARVGIDLIREAGCSTVFTMTDGSLDAGESGGRNFAERLGFEVAQQDIVKRLDLDATAHLWQPILDSASADDYRLLTWRDGCPEEWLDPYLLLIGAFLGEVPLGDLDIEPEIWTVERLRETEERERRTGEHRLTTLAITHSGEAAGFTEYIWDDARPEVVTQEGTLVLREHRGHRLGLRLKAANSLALRDLVPASAYVMTGNAVDNPQMSAINESLGYRPIERSLEMQLRLSR